MNLIFCFLFFYFTDKKYLRNHESLKWIFLYLFLRALRHYSTIWHIPCRLFNHGYLAVHRKPIIITGEHKTGIHSTYRRETDVDLWLGGAGADMEPGNVSGFLCSNLFSEFFSSILIACSLTENRHKQWVNTESHKEREDCYTLK